LSSEEEIRKLVERLNGEDPIDPTKIDVENLIVSYMEAHPETVKKLSRFFLGSTVRALAIIASFDVAVLGLDLAVAHLFGWLYVIPISIALGIGSIAYLIKLLR